jgi:hypothetical protein
MHSLYRSLSAGRTYVPRSVKSEPKSLRAPLERIQHLEVLVIDERHLALREWDFHPATLADSCCVRKRFVVRMNHEHIKAKASPAHATQAPAW